MTLWVWDPLKAEANRKNHQVSFELASRVFGDPLATSRPDPHPDGDRWQTIGMPAASSSVVLFVVHTEPARAPEGEEVGRIISARVAERWERRACQRPLPEGRGLVRETEPSLR